jgi:hypothetical protein
MASKLEIKTPEGASEAYVCDPDSGKLFALEASAKGRVGISIGGYSPMLLEFSSAAMKCDGGWTESGLVDAPPETPPEWNYTPPLDGLRASIGSWDVEIEGAGRKFSAKGAPFGLIRDFAGTDLAYIARRHARPGMDKAPCHEARFDAEYSADFELPEAGAHLLLFESETFAGDWRLEVNGVEIDKSSARREFHYDFMNLVLPVELRKRNRIVVSWRDADEFAGLRSALHVLRRIV